MLLKPELLAAVRGLITQARAEAVRAVDARRVQLYWHIGQMIVEEEQQGADRAAYGSQGLRIKFQGAAVRLFSRAQVRSLAR